MQQYRYKRSNFDELQKNEATSRAGKGWEADEEEKLLSMRSENSSYDEIALELKRTSRSIQTRLYLHICKLVEVENEDESALISKYDIDYNDFALFKTVLSNIGNLTGNLIEVIPLAVINRNLLHLMKIRIII